MTDHLVRKSTAYPPLQRQQVIDPDDEVKDFSELFKETADDMTCNDTFKIYELEGTPYISHSTSFSDLRDLPEPLIAVQDSSPQEETVKVYQMEDTPYNFSNASSISDLTGISGHHSLSDPTQSARTSPRPEQQPKLFTPVAACTTSKLSTVHEDIVETPLVYSRSSPLGSISDEECNQVGDETGSVCSEFSRREEESEAVSPSDLPESPGELEPPAKKITKPAPPPVPPKPKGLLLKLQSRHSEGFVPPPTKFQDTPSALPGPPLSLPSLHHQEQERRETILDNRSDDDDEDDDDLDVDNEFFNKCLELGLRARSSVAVPKNAHPDTKTQSISTPITSLNQKQAPKAIAEVVERNGSGNMSSTDSDSESGDEEDEASDYAFIRMYMERGLRIDTEKEGDRTGVRRTDSPPPPPLPAKRKTLKSSAPVAEKAGSGIGTKPVPSPADSSRSGSWVRAGNVPHRSPPAVPSPVFQSSDPDPRTATSPAFSSSSSSRKPYLETDIDSIVNYEMFLKSINSAAGSGIHSNC